MDAQLVEKVYKSWQRILLDNPDVGKLFYQRLFEIAPDLRPLFTDNVSVQSEKFTSTMTIILSRLYRGSSIISDVEFLAKRHTGYGVKNEHYEKVGIALLWSLEKSMKTDDENYLLVWKSVYESLAQAMIKMSPQNAA
jgi:hemoglobin-like flavoprotein